ncbi:MAG: S24 family peptidase [Saprospiraceae bacterium]
MINDSRLLMNERFIKVFKMLEERGDIVLNDRDGKGMGDFAEKILGNRAYGHIVRAFLNQEDKRVIDYHHIKELCRTYGVNENYMVNGSGSPFGFDLPSQETIVEGNNVKSNILFTSVKAFAGSTIGAESAQEDNQYFGVPGISGGDLVSFPIDGNSMEPIIKNGDIVICRKIESPNDIKDNEIYAIKNNGKIWIKHVQPIFNPRKRITELNLISANYLEHPPFIEEVNEYTQLYRVIRKITRI